MLNSNHNIYKIYNKYDENEQFNIIIMKKKILNYWRLVVHALKLEKIKSNQKNENLVQNDSEVEQLK